MPCDTHAYESARALISSRLLFFAIFDSEFRSLYSIIGRNAPRVVIQAGPVYVSHALHVATQLQIAQIAQIAQITQIADERSASEGPSDACADDDDSATFSSLLVRSLSDISGISCFSPGPSGLSYIADDTAYDDACAYRQEEEEEEVNALTRHVPPMRRVGFRLRDKLHGRLVRSSSATSSCSCSSLGLRAPRRSARAQKAPRSACIELGETAFAFGSVACDGEVELTFLGHRVARTRRGDFNARVERRGNALLAVAVDQILVFREIVVDGSWMDDL